MKTNEICTGLDHSLAGSLTSSYAETGKVIVAQKEQA